MIKHTRINFKPSILFFLLFAPPIATAQTSKDFAEMGAKSWASFQCSSLSSAMKNEKEVYRLFKLGYEDEKRSLTAVEAGNVKNEDIHNEVPSGYTFSMFGLTIEFRLGRIYGIAMEDATKGLFSNSHSGLGSENVQKSQADIKYVQRNCKLIR